MLTRPQRISVAMTAIVLMAAPAHGQESGIPVGTRAPSAMVRTLEGKPVDIGSWVGKHPMVIEFWATWCPSCKQLEPAFLALQKKYGARARFIGVAVSVRDRKSVV